MSNGCSPQTSRLTKASLKLICPPPPPPLFFNRWAPDLCLCPQDQALYSHKCQGVFLSLGPSPKDSPSFANARDNNKPLSCLRSWLRCGAFGQQVAILDHNYIKRKPEPVIIPSLPRKHSTNPDPMPRPLLGLLLLGTPALLTGLVRGTTFGIPSC